MKLKLQMTSLLVAVFAFAGLGSLILKVTAQQEMAVVPTKQPATKSAELKTPPKNGRAAPLSSPTPPPTPANVTRIAQPPRAPRGFFRVTLNGFRVNHESDDDILEGDGRGDEIFITTNNWMIHKDGTYQSFRQIRTKVMGDPNGHPERVAAGTKSPGLRLDSSPGGLQTGDTFPWNQPWKRTRDPLADRPPVVLWNGYLTQGEDTVVLLPIVWEWDSDDVSDSQRSVADGLPLWFNYQRAAIASYSTSPPGSPFHLRSVVVNPVELLTTYYAAFLRQGYSDGVRQGYPQGRIPLAGKAGTRPIGYEEAYTNTSTAETVALPDGLTPIEMVLTYDSATDAARATIDLGVPGVYEFRYVDSHDHGDYSLYLQVERLDTR